LRNNKKRQMNNLPAFEYLMNTRKLNEHTIKTFHLAHCDSRGEVYVDADFIQEIPQLDFRFNNASLFPIQDLYGNCVGVSARPFSPGKDLPKYVNTSYEKSEHLYGLNIAWKDAVKEKTIYVVEGNIDVLQMYERGIKNVCGMLGSAFSVSQLGLLIGFVEKIIFVPDGDMAGLNFMEKTKNTLLKRYKDIPVSFSFLMLPTGFDPDSYLKKFSKEEFLALPQVELK
jgi:DNA primase